MSKSVYIKLNSGSEILIDDFKHITCPPIVSSDEPTVINEFDSFYLYDQLLNFVGANKCVSLSSKDIEYVQFKI